MMPTVTKPSPVHILDWSPQFAEWSRNYSLNPRSILQPVSFPATLILNSGVFAFKSQIWKVSAICQAWNDPLILNVPTDQESAIVTSLSISTSQVIPATSLTLPLLGRYLLFSMVLVAVSVCLATIVLNLHYRKPSTHRMPAWVRNILIQRMPGILCMRVPKQVWRKLSRNFSKSINHIGKQFCTRNVNIKWGPLKYVPFINKSNNYSSSYICNNPRHLRSKAIYKHQKLSLIFRVHFRPISGWQLCAGCKEGPRFLYTKDFQWNGIFFSHLFCAHHLLKYRGKAFRTNICNIWTKLI